MSVSALGGGIDFNDVIEKLNKAVNDQEKNIQTLHTTGDFSKSETVLQMQQNMNEWSYLIGMASSAPKTVSDTLKSIAQKI